MKTDLDDQNGPAETASDALVGLVDLLDPLLDEPGNAAVRLEAKRLLKALQFRMDELAGWVKVIEDKFVNQQPL